MSFLNKTFIADSVERAVKTVAQSMVALLTASGVLGLLDIDFVTLLSVSGLAGLVSILTSIASASTGDPKSASLVTENKTLK